MSQPSRMGSFQVDLPSSITEPRLKSRRILPLSASSVIVALFIGRRIPRLGSPTSRCTQMRVMPIFYSMDMSLMTHSREPFVYRYRQLLALP
ncbi:hypothetical protein PROFUN_05149 [Planoprotostelium fungivorum]|uniref:Uncharacterized protein n=1 Tax=Planoprotostelium fungivorum TaxID=1890364 RepID=A0A2P6NRY0_9EUKA|nr:hypothetical protein PROFUN_05149 [Planoprotostelium fungivorum]